MSDMYYFTIKGNVLQTRRSYDGEVMEEQIVENPELWREQNERYKQFIERQWEDERRDLHHDQG